MLKRVWALLLAICLSLAPMTAMAATVSIGFPIDAGLLYVGQSVTLKPELKGVKLNKLSWKSSSKSVATMSSNKLTANGEGLCVISASYKKASASMGLAVLPRTLSMKTGTSHSLPYNGMLGYSSDNVSVATVGTNGTILAVNPGTARITVSYRTMSLAVQVTVTGTASGKQSRAAQLDCASATTQIVLVEYEGGSKATVSLHEKKDGIWTEVFSTYGYVGKNGIGKTKEGDKKTPSGTYNLTTPFGIKDDPGCPLKYTKVTKYHYWCGSSSSGYYNQFCDSRVNGRKYTSSDEHLIDYKGVYNYCLFIDYNKAGVAHKGSCIFLHCTGSNKYTAGCVAIPEKYMKQLICRVRSGAKIVIKEK